MTDFEQLGNGGILVAAANQPRRSMIDTNGEAHEMVDDDLMEAAHGIVHQSRRDSAGAQVATALVKSTSPRHDRRARTDPDPTTDKETTMNASPLETGRPPVEDSMSAVQDLEDERATQVWLERQRKAIYRRVSPKAQLQIQVLTLAEVALGDVLTVFADPEVSAETCFDGVLAAELPDLAVAERIGHLRRDLQLVAGIVRKAGTELRNAVGEPV